MRETWYVLEDGAAADPREVAPDDAGVLRHVSGQAVAMRGQVPSSRGVDPDDERAKAEAAAESAAKADAAQKSEAAAKAEAGKHSAKDIKPEDHKRGYKTRESKVD